MGNRPENFVFWPRGARLLYLLARGADGLCDLTYKIALGVTLGVAGWPLLGWVLTGELGAYTAGQGGAALRSAAIGIGAVVLGLIAVGLRQRLEVRHG